MKSEIAGTLVEWDENKNQQNIKKHGISFQTAALVFADEERIEYLDKMRDEYARLISARMATPYERKIYYGEE